MAAIIGKFFDLILWIIIIAFCIKFIIPFLLRVIEIICEIFLTIYYLISINFYKIRDYFWEKKRSKEYKKVAKQILNNEIHDKNLLLFKDSKSHHFDENISFCLVKKSKSELVDYLYRMTEFEPMKTNRKYFDQFFYFIPNEDFPEIAKSTNEYNFWQTLRNEHEFVELADIQYKILMNKKASKEQERIENLFKTADDEFWESTKSKKQKNKERKMRDNEIRKKFDYYNNQISLSKRDTSEFVRQIKFEKMNNLNNDENNGNNENNTNNTNNENNENNETN